MDPVASSRASARRAAHALAPWGSARPQPAAEAWRRERAALARRRPVRGEGA